MGSNGGWSMLNGDGTGDEKEFKFDVGQTVCGIMMDYVKDKVKFKRK